jgi:hypothetical protein
MRFPYPGQPVIVKSSKRSADLGPLMILPVTNPGPFPGPSDGPPPIIVASVTYQDNGQTDIVAAADIEPVYPQLSQVEITLIEPDPQSSNA